MVRMLLALSLAFASFGSLAAEVPVAASDDAACPKQEADAGKASTGDEGTTAVRPGTPAPVRARAAGRGAPRWQSLLPGMFR